MAFATHQYTRRLAARVRSDLDRYPAVAIMGARQVGKTTLARQLARELGLAWRSLDDQDVRVQAREDPAGLVASVADTGAVLDEVQRAPELLLAVKAVVDREQKTGRFILTGSNQPRVSAQVADSLVGRVAYRTLRPLTLSEQREDPGPGHWSLLFGNSPDALGAELQEASQLNGPVPWRAATATGGMPRYLALTEDERLQALDDYLQTFARRDIREVLAVESADRLERFMRLVAARSAMELNHADLARDLGQSMSPSTVGRWIEALERSYLVSLLPAWSRNASARIIRRPKLLMVDSALAMAGSGEPAPTGFQFETLVANDLLAWRDEAPRRALYHWRQSTGPEVDFILQQGNSLVAVEVKGSDAVGRRDARHLRAFLAAHDEATLGVILSSDPRVRWLEEQIIAAPWWAVL